MIEPLPIQHDDHIWMTVFGEGWAIKRIDRDHDEIVMRLWRGYEPTLEHMAVRITHQNWPAYCAAAIAMMKEQYPDA